MAKKYREMVVKGDDKLIKGFLSGFRAGKGITEEFIICRDHPINTHHLREILTFRGDYVHLITRNRHGKVLSTAIQEADLDFELVSDNLISKASFEFKFETFSKDAAAGLKKLLQNLPENITLVNYSANEDVDPSASGVEMYTPAHDYRYHGGGRSEGDIETVLAWHSTLDANEFVELEKIDIEH